VEQDDLDLIARAERGDADAFSVLIRRHAPRVHSVAYQMVGNSTDAQDIAQEVFIRMHHHLSRYDSRNAFSTWLYRVTVNLAIDFLRRNARHRHEPIHAADEGTRGGDQSDPTDANTMCKEFRVTIHELLDTLPERQRQVFVLRDLQDFSTDEVSRILACRASTVRVHLARARLRVREALAISYPEYAEEVR